MEEQGDGLATLSDFSHLLARRMGSSEERRISLSVVRQTRVSSIARPRSVVEVANYLFRGQRGLVLLVIDPDRVISPIRYEDAGNGKLYPHIYGPLNPGAVVAVEPFEPSAAGTFELPKRLN